MTGGVAGGSLGPSEWPQGCLGYAFNLVRPTRPGHRASLLYSLLGSVLVFETLQEASAYRELVTQVGCLMLLAQEYTDSVCFGGVVALCMSVSDHWVD